MRLLTPPPTPPLCFLTSCKASPSHLWNVETLSKLSSDPIPSVELRPGSKWEGSRHGGVGGAAEEGGDWGSAHWCRAACAGTLPVLRGRIGGGSRPGCRPRDPWFLLAGPNPLSVCVCVEARRWHGSHEPLPSPLKIRWWYRLPFGTTLTDGLCVTHMPLSAGACSWNTYGLHWNELPAWPLVKLDYEWVTNSRSHVWDIPFLQTPFHADNVELCSGWCSSSIWFSSTKNHSGVSPLTSYLFFFSFFHCN